MITAIPSFTPQAPKKNIPSALTDGGKNNGKIKIDGKKYLPVSNSVADTGWSVAAAVLYNFVTSSAKTLLNRLVSLSLICAAVIIIMTVDELDKLAEKLSRRAMPAEHGIGLYNVNERLRLYFSDNRGLIIQRRENEGMSVSFSIPASPDADALYQFKKPRKEG